MPRRTTRPRSLSRTARRRDCRGNAARHFQRSGADRGPQLPTGDYELWLTAAGNPANVLFTRAPSGCRRHHGDFVVGPGRSRRGELSVLLLQGSSTLLFDRNATHEMRVVNGATDPCRGTSRSTANSRRRCFPRSRSRADGIRKDAARLAQINVTPVGNPGVLELNQRYRAQGQTTLLFTGPRALWRVTGLDDGRRIHGEAKLRFLNAVSQFAGLDFVLTLPGGDPTCPPAFRSAEGARNPPVSAISLPRDTTCTRGDSTRLVLSGPTRITVAATGSTACLPSTAPTRPRSPAFFRRLP